MRRPQFVALSLLALVACAGESDNGQRGRGERAGTAADALVSAEFNIGCDPVVVGMPPYGPGVAVNGAVAMASWVSPDGTIHAARFDDEGNVLDTGPLLLGRPVPLASYGNWQALRGTQLIATPTGWIVLAQFKAFAIIGYIETIHWRQLDLAGVPLSDWQQLDFAEGNSSVQSNVYLGNSGWDGANWYATSRIYYPQGAFATYVIRVHENGSAGTIISLPSYWNGTTYVWPQWGGLGCGPHGCFATWQEALTNVVKTQVMGQPEQVAAAFHPGTVVGTPSGFLTTSQQIVEYDPSGVEVGVGATGLPNSRGVFDGTATRIFAHENGDILSTTVGDDGALLAPLAVEIPGATLSARSVASFGSERVVMAEALATGVVGRFVGSVPAAVPTECWAAPGSGGAAPTGGAGGGGGGASGGFGGAGAVGGAPAGGAGPIGGGGSGGDGGAAPIAGSAAGGAGGIATIGGGGQGPSGGNAPQGGAPAIGGASLGGSREGGGTPVGGNGTTPAAGGGSGPGDGSSSGCDCSATGELQAAPYGLMLLALSLLRQTGSKRTLASRARGRGRRIAPSAPCR